MMPTVRVRVVDARLVVVAQRPPDIEALVFRVVVAVRIQSERFERAV